MEIKAQLLNDVKDPFNRRRGVDDITMGDALCGPVRDCPPKTDLVPEDDVSQILSCQEAMSTTPSKLLAHRIDLDRRRAEFQAVYARDLARAKADAATAAAPAQADAEARLQAGVAKLVAEEKCIALSESGSSVAVYGRYEHKLCLSSVVASGVPKIMNTRKTDLNRKCVNANFRESDNVAAASCRPTWSASEAFGYTSALGGTTPKVERTCSADPGLRPAACSQRQETTSYFVTSNTTGFEGTSIAQ